MSNHRENYNLCILFQDILGKVQKFVSNSWVFLEILKLPQIFKSGGR